MYTACSICDKVNELGEITNRQKGFLPVPADLFIYAIVAAGLIFWLRRVLGTRHGEERPRYENLKDINAAQKELNRELEEVTSTVSRDNEIRELAQNPVKNYSIANKTAENGLIDISNKSDFDVHFFMEGSQDAFAIVVEAFADGDRETLQDLLGDDVYRAFEAAITEREERGETQITDIHSIRSAEVVDARLEGRQAKITVKFKAEESSVTKDADDKVIAGHPDKISEMQDIWTFGRDIKSKNPAWIVVETRGDFEEDNELIPDTH